MRITSLKQARPLLAYALMFALAALALAIRGPDSPPADVTFDDYYFSGHVDLRFPAYQELSDWVSFTDQVSVVTILHDHEIEPITVVRSGHEFIETPPTLRIEETVWRRD